MNKKEDSTLKTLKDYLPLIYVLLVCFGYFNKSLYYDKFGIDILHHLNIPELILMFIPVGSALVTAFLFLIIIIAPMVVFGPSNEDLELEAKKDRFNIYLKLDKIKNSKTKKISKKLYWVIAIITSTYLNFVPILLFFYFAVFKNFENTLYISKIAVILMIIWAFIFVLKFRFQNSKSKFNPRIQIFVYFIMTIIGFIVYSDINLNKADSILNGKSEYYVKFEINNQLIETNSKLLFIGQTNNYVFLRKIDSRENHIYNKKDISEFIIKKNEK
ncbi:hypothetical protein ACFSKN_04210 [Mariniflexile gromovii]|uniref:Uncharacterized protein n=1 Tax=Mariniflexile gromovii TaxID=362523 RepID=A0ABS4BT54_9FLAO|nr:hypothetical protein [Mariniflexile gromovii]MBP0903770.1 hypothetical protein [Mariniflexile gromovii]